MKRPPPPHLAPGRTLLLATDRSRSILAEATSGAVNRTAYSPYGSQRTDGVKQAHLGFNGELRDRAHGWYHLGNGHRIYNPVLRRFHSPDRLSPFAEGGLNPYAYCVGDPINHVDPTGRAPNFMQVLTLIGVVLGIASGGATLVGPLLLKGAKSAVAGMVAPGLFKSLSGGKMAAGLFGPKGRIAGYLASEPPIGAVAAGGLDAWGTMTGMISLVPTAVDTVHNIEHPMNFSTSLRLTASVFGLFVVPTKLLAAYTPRLANTEGGLRFARLVHGRAKVRAAQKKAGVGKYANKPTGEAAPTPGQLEALPPPLPTSSPPSRLGGPPPLPPGPPPVGRAVRQSGGIYIPPIWV